MFRLFVILVLLMCFPLNSMAAGNPAAPSTRPARVTKTPQGLILNFQNEPVDAIVSELCQTLGLKLVKEGTIVSRVTVVSPNPISSEDAWALINVLVENTGFQIVQAGLEVKLILKKNGLAVE